MRGITVNKILQETFLGAIDCTQELDWISSSVKPIIAIVADSDLGPKLAAGLRDSFQVEMFDEDPEEDYAVKVVLMGTECKLHVNGRKVFTSPYSHEDIIRAIRELSSIRS